MKKLSGFAFLLLFFSQSYGQQREFSFYIEKKDGKTFLQITSAETFPCIGYTIKTFEVWDNDTLVVDIRGFIQPTPCYQGMDVAKTNQPILGVRTKQFTIKFRWEGKTDTWIIEVEGDSFKATPERGTFTSWFRG